MDETMTHHIGFISTRFAGTDGVSLETQKWATVLERLGHKCFYFAGECDRNSDQSQVTPEAFYRHPEIDKINQQAYSGSWTVTKEARAAHPEIAKLHKDFFSMYIRPPQMTCRVNELKEYLKERLYEFAHLFDLEILVIENAVTIPLNLPLGLAITEFIAETGFPTIAHHHDFHWERQRFQVNCVGDYLAAAFPPTLPSIRHVVINSLQAQQIASRYGVTSRVIPNVMDFDSPPSAPDAYTQNIRADFGVAPNEYFFLQPTRVIQRKGIEHAVELVRRLELPAKLVISHASGDEGTDYEQRVREYAHLLDVTVRFESDQVQDERGITKDGKRFTHWAMYIHMPIWLRIRQVLKALAMPFWKPCIIAVRFWLIIIPSMKWISNPRAFARSGLMALSARTHWMWFVIFCKIPRRRKYGQRKIIN
jgi:glycosyltransferase involved in cell wall biosynthesis